MNSIKNILSPENQYRILVVDDQPVTVKLIKNYLTANNLFTETANDGIEALEIIEREPEFDLVIHDITMPVMSGYEVVRKLREKYSLFELPIIFLTANNDISYKLAGFEAGANDFITKPFDSAELLVRVKTLIKLKRLTKANNILQEAISLKNQFHQMTIHDMRNPLTSILLFAGMLKSEFEKNSEYIDYLNMIIQSADLMLNLTNDFLEVSSLESGKIQLNKEKIEITTILRASLECNLPKATAKNQKIEYTNKPVCSYITKADPLRIQQVIDNLISNAIKYSPLYTTIWVCVESVFNEEEEEFVRISIRDEGPGFSEEDKRLMFGKFRKLSAQPTAGESASGLGLSIAKQLVEMHDGKIYLISPDSGGSEFRIEFPISKD